MTRLTIFGGAGEIGGNKLLLEDPGGNVLLDFGKSLGQYSRYFQGYNAPASARGLHDHVMLGLVPPLRGIYREDLQPTDWSPWDEVSSRYINVDGILLTHAHQDHCGCLPYVDPSIPVFMSAQTAMVLRHLQDWGSVHLDGEFRYVKRRIMRSGALMAAQTQRDGEHRLRTAQIPPEEPWELVSHLWEEVPGSKKFIASPPIRSDWVGNLPVRMYPVDHSMAGSCAFAVQTEAGWVVYTGDLRRHGLRGALTDAFVEAAADLNPAVLITEGTNIEDPPGYSEADVKERLLQTVKREQGLVVINFAARNLDRLLNVYDIARDTGRQLVITEREADFLRNLRPLRPEIPDPDSDPWLCIYYRPRAADDTWHRFWRRPGRRPPEGSGSDRYLRAHPEEYILCFGLADMDELVGMKMQRGGLMIYSNHKPYNPEQEAQMQRLVAWANFFGLRTCGFEEDGYHSSGHISGTELDTLITRLNPRHLIPVHTLSPSFFTRWAPTRRLTLPNMGQSIEL